MNRTAHGFARAATQARTGPVGPAAATGWQRDDRLWLPIGAMVWLLIVMMIVPEGFDYNDLSTTGMPSSGSALTRLLWLGLLGTGALLLLWRSALAWLLARWLNPFFLAFVALASASVLWSIEPSVTVRRLIRLFAIVFVASAFVLAAWHARRYQNTVRPILTIMLLGSILFGLAFPHLAIHQEQSHELVGAWRGLANHKNTLGALSSICAIFWFHAWLAREVRWGSALVGGGIALTTLLLSRSSTSLVTTIFVVLFLVMMLRSPPNLRRYMPYFVTIFVIALLAYALAVLRLVPGLEILLKPVVMITGKDLTFTGRSEIWEILNAHIRFHPWLGTGYGAYWIGPVPHSPSYEFVVKMHFYPGSAHNGYLEVMNDLGAVGMLCLGGYLATHVSQSLRLLHEDRSQAALYLGLFFQQAISNLSETHWLSVMNVDFIIVTLATFALARGRLELRLRSYFGAPAAAAAPAATIVIDTPHHRSAQPPFSPATTAPLYRPAASGRKRQDETLDNLDTAKDRLRQRRHHSLA